MERSEALRIATEWVDKYAAPEKNERGYARDGWKPVSLTERASVTLDLANWLLGPEPPKENAPPATPHFTNFPMPPPPPPT